MYENVFCLQYASYCCGVIGFFLSFDLEAVFALTSELQIAVTSLFFLTYLVRTRGTNIVKNFFFFYKVVIYLSFWPQISQKLVIVFLLFFLGDNRIHI